MIVVMKPEARPDHVEHVVELLRALGTVPHVIAGRAQPVIELLETNGELDTARVRQAPMVAEVLAAPQPVLATHGAGDAAPRVVALGNGHFLGAERVAVIAGPCSVESEERLLVTARAVAAAGGVALRGGAFKPRTSPYAFDGLHEEGLKLLARARDETGLAIVTEVMSPERVPLVADYADVLQVGSRNMHNAPLLHAVGRQSKPVLLKRSWSATLREFLAAAEHVLHAGNAQVILCERGIRTHEDYVRNTLALAIVPELKQRTVLPVVVDPSHGTGRADLVPAMSRAALAAGADGLLIEVHPDPRHAWSDADQALDLAGFQQLMKSLAPLATALGRRL